MAIQFAFGQAGRLFLALHADHSGGRCAGKFEQL